MTFSKLMKLYNHYKNHYDFTLRKMSYRELEKEASTRGEWIPD